MSKKPVGIANGLTNYGDRDFSLYLRRSFAKSMGYTNASLEKPVVGIAYTGSGFNNCHRHFPELLAGSEARRARGRRAAGGIPDHLARRSLPQPDQPEIPQPDVDRHRGNGARAADGFGRADGRLRQDGAGAIDGRGLRRQARR